MQLSLYLKLFINFVVAIWVYITVFLLLLCRITMITFIEDKTMEKTTVKFVNEKPLLQYVSQCKQIAFQHVTFSGYCRIFWSKESALDSLMMTASRSAGI